MNCMRFSSASMTFLRLSQFEFLATVDIMQRYVSCVSSDARDQSAVKVLEKMLFSSRHQLLHRLTTKDVMADRTVLVIYFQFPSHGHVLPFLEI